MRATEFLAIEGGHMFYEEEIGAGCEITFRPTDTQRLHFTGYTDLQGNLSGIVLYKVLGSRWMVCVRGETATVLREAIAILSEGNVRSSNEKELG